MYNNLFMSQQQETKKAITFSTFDTIIIDKQMYSFLFFFFFCFKSIFAALFVFSLDTAMALTFGESILHKHLQQCFLVMDRLFL